MNSLLISLGNGVAQAARRTSWYAQAWRPRMPGQARWACLVVTCIVIVGCTGPSSPAKNKQVQYATNGTFTIGTRDDPGSFDPYRAHTLFSFAYLAYDSLVNLRPDGTFVTGLAEKWSADARSATFVLRPDVTCSDRTELTASQVAAAINYVTNPKNGSPQYGVNTPTVPLIAVGDNSTRTVKVTMKKEPFGFLLRTIGQLPIVCAAGMKNPRVLKSGSNGTGPFVLTTVVPGQSYTFTTRKDYRWGPGGASTREAGTPAKIVIKVLNNETTAVNLMLAGQLNFLQVSGEDRRRLDAAHLKTVRDLWSGPLLSFNQSAGLPTADLRVRQALVQALNRDQLIRVSTGGTGTAATGVVTKEPKVCAGNTVAGQVPNYDQNAAQSLLDQAGWTKGSDGFRRKAGTPLNLDLHYIPGVSEFNKPTVELIANSWEAIGVHVKPIGESATAYFKAAYETRSWDVLLDGFGVTLPTQLVAYFSGPVPPQGSNYAHRNNKTYNTLVRKAQALTPPEACTYWNQAEQALWRDFDIMPISQGADVYYYRNSTLQATAFNFPIPTSIRLFR